MGGWCLHLYYIGEDHSFICEKHLLSMGKEGKVKICIEI